MDRLISLYDVSDPSLWRFVLIPLAGAGMLFGVLWVFVRNRSRRAKGIAVVVSALSPTAVWMAAMIPKAGSAGMGGWLFGVGAVAVIAVCGYLIFSGWADLRHRSSEQLSTPDGTAPHRQDEIVRNVTVGLVGFVVLLVAGVFYLLASGIW